MIQQSLSLSIAELCNPISANVLYFLPPPGVSPSVLSLTRRLLAAVLADPLLSRPLPELRGSGVAGLRRVPGLLGILCLGDGLAYAPEVPLGLLPLGDGVRLASARC